MFPVSVSRDSGEVKQDPVDDKASDPASPSRLPAPSLSRDLTAPSGDDSPVGALRVRDPLPLPLRAEEEDKQFSLREVSKSSSTAITVIMYYRSNLRTVRKPLRRDKLDLITSAIHVHGKVYPEIFFFGIDCIRANLELLSKELMGSSRPETLAAVSDLVDQVLPLAIQFAINSVDFFRTKNSNDYLVFSAFNFLLFIAAHFDRFVAPLLTGSIAKLFSTLMDSLSSEILAQLSPETCATLLCAIAVYGSMNRPRDSANVFFRENFFDFFADMIVSGGDVADEDSLSVNELRVYSFLYISSILKTMDGKRAIVLQKIFASPIMMEKSIALLTPLLNARFALASVLGFISTVMHSGLKLTSSTPRPNDEDDGLGGLLFSAISENIGSGSDTVSRKNFDQVVGAIDIEVLDDVFTAYMEDGGMTDGEILILLNSIGAGLVRFSQRSSVVLSVIRKWAVTSASSGYNPYLVASGIELAAIIARFANERFENIVGCDALDAAIETMKIRSVGWAGDQVMGSMKSIVTEDLANRVFAHLNFHPQMFLDEKWKIFFFKKFSIKEIFLRVISVMNWITDIRDLREVSRVAIQMIVAMKTKQIWTEIQNEIVLIESERFRTGPRSGGFLTWTLSALNVAKDDWETTEMLLFILTESFLKTENLKQEVAKIVDGIVACLKPEYRQKAANILLGAGGPKYKPPNLASPSGDMRTVQTVLSCLIESHTIPIDLLLEKSEKKNGEKAKEEKKGAGPAADSEPGWADSAAMWFLDLAEGESEDADSSDDDGKSTEEHREDGKNETKKPEVEQHVKLDQPKPAAPLPKPPIMKVPVGVKPVVKAHPWPRNLA